MSKNSHTLHPDVFHCKPAALKSRTVSNGTRQLCSMSMVVGRSSIDGWLLEALRRSIGDLPIRLIVGERAELSPRPGVDPIATVSISDRRTLARLLFSPEIAFGDGYTDGQHCSGRRPGSAAGDVLSG